ncbi:MAG: hypothetical protein ABSF99_14005 [Anaerolineales bacterium]
MRRAFSVYKFSASILPTDTVAPTPTQIALPTQTATPTTIPFPALTLKPGEFYFSLDGQTRFIFSRNVATFFFVCLPVQITIQTR